MIGKGLSTPSYDSKLSCNSCGSDSSNNAEIVEVIAGEICECKTVCAKCGHNDYWAYGFFESRGNGLNKAKKYR